MENNTTSLTIIGEPEEMVRVFVRDRGDEPPPPVWEGKLDADGRTTLDVPQSYLVVFGSHSNRGWILHLEEDKPAELTIRLEDQINNYPSSLEGDRDVDF